MRLIAGHTLTQVHSSAKETQTSHGEDSEQSHGLASDVGSYLSSSEVLFAGVGHGLRPCVLGSPMTPPRTITQHPYLGHLCQERTEAQDEPECMRSGYLHAEGVQSERREREPHQSQSERTRPECDVPENSPIAE